MYRHAPCALALGAITFRDRSFEEILSAAGAAGFEGIGLTVGQCLSALERGVPLEHIPTRLADAGLRLAELELVRLGQAGPIVHANALVEELAGLLGPDRLHVASWATDRAEIVRHFAQVCAAVPDRPVAFEFMAYNAVPGFVQALELAEATAAPNAAVVLDILHFFRTGATFDQLTAEAMRRVAVVQLSDVVARPRGDAFTEARHQRTYPGRGALDSAGFLEALRATGALPPISVEPINDAYEVLPLSFVAEEAMLATAQLLGEVPER